MSGKQQTTGIGVGGTSILMIFVLLCLTTFAALSLVSANADKKLTDRTALAVTAYYEADSEAEARRAALDVLYRDAMAAGSGRQAAYEALSTAEGAQVLLDGEEISVFYQLPCGEERALAVRLMAMPGDEHLRVSSWQVISLHDPEEYEEQGMNLLGGPAIG